MAKVDYKKELKELYNPSKKEVVAINVPKMNFLMIDGKGSPQGEEFKNAIEAIYPVAYTIKFAIKKAGGLDYVVPPLEALWWSDNMEDFVTGNKDNWQWTVMIMQPDFVTENIVKEAIEKVKNKREIPVSLPKLRLGSYEEGDAAHVLYLGAYSDEGPTIKEIHDFIHARGKERRGKHHEIYLSDFRRVAPEK